MERAVRVPALADYGVDATNYRASRASSPRSSTAPTREPRPRVMTFLRTAHQQGVDRSATGQPGPGARPGRRRRAHPAIRLIRIKSAPTGRPFSEFAETRLGSQLPPALAAALTSTQVAAQRGFGNCHVLGAECRPPGSECSWRARRVETRGLLPPDAPADPRGSMRCSEPLKRRRGPHRSSGERVGAGRTGWTPTSIS